MKLSKFSIIPGLHENIFKEHCNFFHVTSEVDILIHKKNSTDIRFHKKMSNHDDKGYLLTTNFYKGKIYATLLVPHKRNTEGKFIRTAVRDASQ